MAQKTKSRNEASHETHQHASNAADAARQSYEQVNRAGQTMQEQAGIWWRTLMGAADWQRQAESFTQITRSTLPLAQRSMEQLMELMEKSSRSSMDLMRRMIEAVQTPLTGESQNAWMQLWTSSTKAAQANAEGFMEFSTRAIDSWSQFVRKVSEATPKPSITAV